MGISSRKGDSTLIIFNKPIVTDGDIQLNYHLITKIELTTDLDGIGIYISSWPSENSRKSNSNPVAYAYEKVLIDNLENSKTIISDIVSNLTSTGYLQGGSPVEELSTNLQIAKTQKWTIIKSKKYLKEYGGFTWNNYIFDSDETSQSKILTAVIMAQQSIIENKSFSVSWTLKDNSVQNFSAQDMVAIGQSMANHIFNTHQTAEGLREQIDQATTVQEVNSITWPS